MGRSIAVKTEIAGGFVLDKCPVEVMDLHGGITMLEESNI
jgi:hypothetical protein